MGQMTQRDAFLNRLYDIMHDDPDVVLISADMGAPALDRIRRNKANQFINVGIAEQNAVAVASGLAMAGKKVYTYAIATFMSIRCLEQIRVENAMMKIPVTIVGVGAGFSYEDSGPTHHGVDDLAIMRALPNLVVNNVSDSVMATQMADISYKAKLPNYLRLERYPFPDIYKTGDTFDSGVAVVRQGTDIVMFATGATVHVALEIADALDKKGVSMGVVDIYNFPVNNEAILDALNMAPRAASFEEHFLPGGLGSAVAETFVDNGLTKPLKRFGFDTAKGYCYIYGGRDILRGYYDVSKPQVEQAILDYVSTGYTEKTEGIQVPAK